jgi:ribosomal protein L44E
MSLSGDGCMPRSTEKAAQDRIWQGLDAGCHCGGATATVKQRRKAHGGIVVTLQCDTCGRSLTGDLTRAHFPFYLDLPQWDQAKQDDWHARTSFEARQWMADREAQFQAGREQLRREAADFRATPEWRNMRNAVMARARFICEACGENAAEQVHHLNYDQGYGCPLYNLRAVCRPCHTRLHRAGDPWHLPHLPAVGE